MQKNQAKIKDSIKAIEILERSPIETIFYEIFHFQKPFSSKDFMKAIGKGIFKEKLKTQKKKVQKIYYAK